MIYYVKRWEEPWKKDTRDQGCWLEENCHLKQMMVRVGLIEKWRSELKLEHVSISHLEVEGTGFQAGRQPGPRLKSEIVLAMLVLRNSKDAGEAGRSKRGAALRR